MTLKTDEACPCGSTQTLIQCCLPIIQGATKARSAEALLRARYTAFTQGNVDFIVNTHHTKTRSEVDRAGIEDWSRNSEWLGLEIVRIEAGTENDQQGIITFHVKYLDKKTQKTQDHHEKSLFEKENGEWRFLDAQAAHPGTIHRESPKVGRNDPCSCGSGKKFKKCCGA